MFVNDIILASIEVEFLHITAFKLQTPLCTRKATIPNADRYTVIKNPVMIFLFYLFTPRSVRSLVRDYISLCLFNYCKL